MYIFFFIYICIQKLKNNTSESNPLSLSLQSKTDTTILSPSTSTIKSLTPISKTNIKQRHGSWTSHNHKQLKKKKFIRKNPYKEMPLTPYDKDPKKYKTHTYF